MMTLPTVCHMGQRAMKNRQIRCCLAAGVLLVGGLSASQIRAQTKPALAVRAK
jgi:hypothetical protein